MLNPEVPIFSNLFYKEIEDPRSGGSGQNYNKLDIRK